MIKKLLTFCEHLKVRLLSALNTAGLQSRTGSGDLLSITGGALYRDFVRTLGYLLSSECDGNLKTQTQTSRRVTQRLVKMEDRCLLTVYSPSIDGTYWQE